MCMCSLSYTACTANVPYYIVICGQSICATLSLKRYEFRGKVIDQKMCVLFFSITFI